MSTFNPTQLENLEVNDSFDTVVIPVPVGEYPGVISKIMFKEAKDNVMMEVLWKIDDQEVIEETGREEPTVRQTVWLDITESGALDNGRAKNVQLGRLRDALGQNVATKTWKFGDLIGGVATVSIRHRQQEDGTTIANVVKVASL